MMTRRGFTAVLGAALLLAVSGPVEARPTARLPDRAAAAPKPLADPPVALETVVEVSVLHGTPEDRPSDPRIGNMPELREGPFAKYRSYQLLSRTELPLTRGGRRELKLPNGRRLETRLEERLADGSARIVARINRPGAEELLPLLEVKAKPGQSFIVAGQSYKRGILVLVFRVLR